MGGDGAGIWRATAEPPFINNGLPVLPSLSLLIRWELMQVLWTTTGGTKLCHAPPRCSPSKPFPLLSTVDYRPSYHTAEPQVPSHLSAVLCWDVPGVRSAPVPGIAQHLHPQHSAACSVTLSPSPCRPSFAHSLLWQERSSVIV